MHYKHTFAAMAALIVTGIASAHQGVPGHVHAELPLAAQALHAAINWAPVVGVVVIAAFGLRRALRRDV